MAGRGRAATLPAWMTAGGLKPAAPGAAASTSAPTQPTPAAVAAAPGSQHVPASFPGGWQPPAAAASAAPPAARPGGYTTPAQQPLPGGLPAGAPQYGPMSGAGGPRPLMGAPAPHLGMPAAAGAGPPGYGMYGPPGAMPVGMQPSPRPAAAPAAAAAPAGAAGGGWTEHTAPDGRKYYYNAATKVSSWEKPADMQSPQEAESAWKEYTAPDGRKYYHNKVTKESRWTMPESMQRQRAAANGSTTAATTPSPTSMQASPRQQQHTPPDSAAANGPAAAYAGQPHVAAAAAVQAPNPQVNIRPVSPQRARAPVVHAKVEYASKEEAKDAFKQLLNDFGISPDANWDGVLRQVINDPRYSALKTLGERKAAFNEYCQAKRNEERENARRRLVAAREDFVAMVSEEAQLGPSSRFGDAEGLLRFDPRWRAIPDDRERRELFDEALRERTKRERRAKEEELKRKEAAFKELLAERGIKVTSQWRKVQSKLEDDERYLALDRLERLEAFQRHIKALEEEVKQEKERAKEEERRQERCNRDAFREMLARHKAEGRIGVKMRWKEYEPTIEREETYQAVKKNLSGSRPRELFEDVVEQLEEAYDKAKPLLKDQLRAANFAATTSTSYEEYLGALEGGGEAVAEVADHLKRAYYEELVGKARAKEADAERRRKRARDDYSSFLRHAKGLTPETPWDLFFSTFEKEPELKAVGVEVAKELFGEHIAHLKRKENKRRASRSGAGDGSGGEEGEGREDKGEGMDDHHRSSSKDHKKRKSRRHDDEHKSSKRHKRERSSRERSRERSRSRAAAGGADSTAGGAGGGVDGVPAQQADAAAQDAAAGEPEEGELAE